ncbi:hypothetical protein CU098_007685 [Rhizopus stolonifer]|uniref:Uncharacterized protein n=1 Tax=Rhizopus stolonifer TaxID=4846 RepID=A0A367KDL9_RHIST|nr:hypothetical protein CU098_007685 [Rhizopus stolonifer]
MVLSRRNQNRTFPITIISSGRNSSQQTGYSSWAEVVSSSARKIQSFRPMMITSSVPTTNTAITDVPLISASNAPSSIHQNQIEKTPLFAFTLTKPDMESQLSRFDQVLDLGVTTVEGCFTGQEYATLNYLQPEISIPDLNLCNGADCPQHKKFSKCYNSNEREHRMCQCPRNNTIDTTTAPSKKRIANKERKVPSPTVDQEVNQVAPSLGYQIKKAMTEKDPETTIESDEEPMIEQAKKSIGGLAGPVTTEIHSGLESKQQIVKRPDSQIMLSHVPKHIRLNEQYCTHMTASISMVEIIEESKQSPREYNTGLDELPYQRFLPGRYIAKNGLAVQAMMEDAQKHSIEASKRRLRLGAEAISGKNV